MATQPQRHWRPWRGETGQSEREEPSDCVGRQLGEAGKFAYTALCAISLASLFPEQEESSYRTGFVKSLVQWLELPEAVLPAMMAFARGLGGEGIETFTQILLKDPALKDDAGIITQDLLAFSLKDGYYDARARVLLSHVTWLLRIPLVTLEASEECLLECLKEEKEEESETAEASRKRKEKKKRWKRYLLIGLATVGGGTVIGLTGGLAAPLVAAGAATIIGSAGAAALGSAAGIAVMASLFGAAGAGLTGYKMKKRVGAIEEFEFLSLTKGKQLHVTVAITGWLSTGKYGSFTAPWSSLLQSREQYCLAWESKYLMELGNALDSLLNGLVNMVAQEALKYTVLCGIVTALTWPASLLTVASVIDNPWGVCLHRSAEVGKHLAQILLRRQQGKRPVSLIGFSLGARVIYFCLREMAKEEDCRGIIEDVVLLGAPVEGDTKCWKPLTKVVSGKIINGYCRGDWLLSFVYRTSSVQLNVAGLQPVNLDDRRMVNVDLSSVVSGHLDYMKQMDTILKAVGVKTCECRLEEQGSLACLSDEPKQGPEVSLHSPAQEKQSRRGGQENGKDYWSWEPVSSHGSCPQDPPQEADVEQKSIADAESSQKLPDQEGSLAICSARSPELSGVTDQHICSASAPTLT
ncbi:transmembrane and coiled-coil domain-containing protein 4 isoform X2 [Tiliqua scincoides]